jgi:hypothetical protein
VGEVGAGPVGTLVEPESEVGAELRMNRYFADLVAFADQPQDALGG